MSLSSVRAAHSKISLPGRLAIVVGGTSGLGQAMAERLAKADVSVIIVGRNKEHGNDVLTKLRSYSKTAEHSYVPLDASLLSNVNDFAEQFKASGKRLDYLVLSQGIGSMAGRTETKEGLDVKLSLHYYSRVAFAQLFAPTMATSPDPRVLSILSAGIHSPYEKYEEDPELKNNFSIKNAADAAGFYNDIAMEKLSNQFPKISFIHCAPGFVATRWGTDLSWYIRGPIRFLQLFARSMDDAGEYLSSAFFNDEYKGPGYHFMGAQGQRVKQTNLHDKAKDSVWKSTMIAVNRILGASSSSAAAVDEKH